MKTIDENFIQTVENSDFRTDTDIGANLNALYIWNKVRKHVGLNELKLSDLPSYCTAHKKYHIIKEEYGCTRVKKN